jgi:hypothetical protein
MTHLSSHGSEGAVRPAHRQKHPQDTAEGCHAFAAADRARATAMGTAQARAKLEHSADSWAARGDMLRRLDAKFEARLQRPLS